MAIHLLNDSDIEIIPQFCWRLNWYSPFESPWGIFEKFKMANNATANDLLKIFGKQYVKNLRAIGKIHYNLFDLESFDEITLMKLLKFNPVEINRVNIEQIIGILPDELLGKNHKNNSFYLRENLTICLECMKKGYHSFFHQFKLLDKCPYHNLPLLSACQHCQSKIPYELSDKFFIEPFRCICGNYYFKPNTVSSFFSHWEQTPINRLTCKKLKVLLALNKEEKDILKTMYLFPELNLDEYPETLDNILSLIDSSIESNINYHYTVVKSAKNIKQKFGLKEKYEHNNFSNIGDPRIYDGQASQYRFKAFQIELHKSIQITISGIAKNIRKNRLANHKTCIKKLTDLNNFEPICPNAYSYVFWRKFSQNFRTYNGVDNRGIPLREQKHSIEFPDFFDQYLDKIYESWKEKIFDITLESRSATKWILNRLLVHFLFHHFNNWLEVATDYAERKLIPHLPPFNNSKMPFFVVIFSSKENEAFEFHSWTKINNLNLTLECPFHTQKKK